MQCAHCSCSDAAPYKDMYGHKTILCPRCGRISISGRDMFLEKKGRCVCGLTIKECRESGGHEKIIQYAIAMGDERFYLQRGGSQKFAEPKPEKKYTRKKQDA